jgi:hypothetical protein
MATRKARVSTDPTAVVGDVVASFVYPFTIAASRERSRSPWFGMPDFLDGALAAAREHQTRAAVSYRSLRSMTRAKRSTLRTNTNQSS